MEKNKEKQSEPLYYIEQPSFSNIGGKLQTVSVRKRIGQKPEGKQNKKEKRARQKNKQKRDKDKSLEQGENEQHQPETDNESVHAEQSASDEEKAAIKKEQPSNKNIEEMLSYVLSLPHFIQPVIACETNSKRYQGTLLHRENGEVVIQNSISMNKETIAEQEITDIYIVSL
ncbi:Spore coat protein CotO [Alteribacillus persepolensis]|uniref:Spore coat protein CotO n=1 Tax=Alteribacillus persepolensis TaxID=568899 RepID=A0A1G8EQX0_9BACI|nr:CotO family spore coat protein [Alteribacillus persepolensis]SDH72303.1 Spore coat protein CotO [Alteribacillus persepolensis]